MILLLIEFTILKNIKFLGTYTKLNKFYRNPFAQNKKILVGQYVSR